MRQTPYWLRPEDEVREPALSEDRPLRFALSSVETLRRLGCNFQQAVAVTAVAVIASLWGLFVHEHNLTGVTLTRETARPGVRWFRKGDAYFRAFSSMEDFYKFWLDAYLPKEMGHPYSHVGVDFWANRPWFEQYYASNYRASQIDPEERSLGRGGRAFREQDGDGVRWTLPSDAWMRGQAFMSLWSTIAMAWAQDRIGMDPTGSWTATSDVLLHRWAVRMGHSQDLQWGFQVIELLTGQYEPEPPFWPHRELPSALPPAVHSTIEPSTPSVTEPVEPVVTEPVINAPVEPVVTEPVVTEPAATEPVVTEPAAEPAAEPVVTEPAAEPVPASTASTPKKRR